MELNNKDSDYKRAREKILNILERKREASQSQVRAMEVGELGNTWGEDYNERCWTYEAGHDANHYAEQGLNAITPYGKGWGKNYGFKGKSQAKGNFYGKGWQSNKGWQQGHSKGWQHSDGKTNKSKGWSGQACKGKGKSNGNGFQGECYAGGEWGHSQSRCPHAWNASGSGEYKGKRKGFQIGRGVQDWQCRASGG